jgi:H+/gluconate symporter-like permease
VKIFMTKVSVVAALVVALFIILWQYTPFNPYLWTCFVTFFLYFCGGCKREEFIGYTISSFAGVIYGVIWIAALGAMMAAGASYSLTALVVCGIATFAVCFIHGVLLGSTPVNKIPAAFAGVAVMFAVNAQDPLYIMVCFLGGMIMALAINEIGGWWGSLPARKQSGGQSPDA